MIVVHTGIKERNEVLIRPKIIPFMFEKLHLVITLSGDLDEREVAEVIQETIMHTCPVAAMFRKLFEITWEHHIIECDSQANSPEIAIKTTNSK